MDRTRYLVMGTASWVLAFAVGMTLAAITGSDVVGILAALLVAFGPMVLTTVRLLPRRPRDP
jgi:H+/gluconate symporter-like permease